MTLSDFLDDTGLSEAAFARQSGVSQTRINRIRRGIGSPSWGTARKIVSASGGRVTVESFLPERSGGKKSRSRSSTRPRNREPA